MHLEEQNKNELIVEEPRRRKQVKRFGEQDLMEYSDLETSDSEASEPVGNTVGAGAPGSITPGGGAGSKGSGKRDGRCKKRAYRGEIANKFDGPTCAAGMMFFVYVRHVVFE